MIFVTIGTQEPFDRLIRVMDEISPMFNGIPIVAQVINGTYKVKNMSVFNFLTPAEFDYYFTKADLVVAHAGMGTIISALLAEKPLIVMPRLKKYKEQRNDHQIATVKQFGKLGYVNVAFDESELRLKLFEFFNGDLKSPQRIGPFASPELITSLRKFIETA